MWPQKQTPTDQPTSPDGLQTQPQNTPPSGLKTEPQNTPRSGLKTEPQNTPPSGLKTEPQNTPPSGQGHHMVAIARPYGIPPPMPPNTRYPSDDSAYGDSVDTLAQSNIDVGEDTPQYLGAVDQHSPSSNPQTKKMEMKIHMLKVIGDSMPNVLGNDIPMPCEDPPEWLWSMFQKTRPQSTADGPGTEATSQGSGFMQQRVGMQTSRLPGYLSRGQEATSLASSAVQLNPAMNQLPRHPMNQSSQPPPNFHPPQAVSGLDQLNGHDQRAEPLFMPLHPPRAITKQDGPAATAQAPPVLAAQANPPQPVCGQRNPNGGQPGLDLYPKKRRVRGYTMFAMPRSTRNYTMSIQIMFGTTGSGNGELNEANGLTVFGFFNRQLAIADTNNSRVQIFAVDGHCVRQFDTREPTMQGLFRLFPLRIATTPDNLLAVCFRRPSPQVKLYTAQGDVVSTLGVQELQSPRALAVSRNGDIIVVENRVFKISVFSVVHTTPNRKFYRRCFYFSIAQGFPVDVAVQEKQIFVCDNHLSCVHVYWGNHLKTIGGWGQTDSPVKVLITQLGFILVASNNNSFHVVVFDPSGNYVTTFRSRNKNEDILDVALVERTRTLIVTCANDKVYAYTIPGVPELPLSR